MFRLTSLNLNGIRSAAAKGLQQWMAETRPDCICVQELKAQAADLSGRFEEIAGHKGYFHFAEKKGYSGVGIYTRHEPSDVIVGYGSTEFDAEGRYVELRFDRPGRTHSPKLSIISCYFPSGSSGEERQAAKFRFLAELYPRLLALQQCGGTPREFVLCGDINIAHQEIDLKNFKGNKKNSGFLPQERAWMTELLRSDAAAPTRPIACGLPPLQGVTPPEEAHLQRVQSRAGVTGAAAFSPEWTAAPALAASASGGGMVDVYRRLHPQTTGEAYTWWSNRGQAYAKNVGWRLDYHLATPAIGATACSAAIHKAQRFSDHAPLTINYDWAL